MKIAALILAHKNPAQLIRFVTCLEKAGLDCFIHIDKKSDISLEGRPNCWREFKVYWGGYSTVKATIFLMQKALAAKADYLLLCSGQDYLIATPQKIQQFFSSGKIFMSYQQMPLENWGFNGGLKRFEWYHFQEAPFLNYRINNYAIRLQQKFRVKRKFIPGYTPYGGSQWWAMPAPAASYIMDNISRFERYFKQTLLSDEFFFQTLIMNSPFAKDVINDNLRKIEWHRGPEFPRIWREEDIEELINSECIIARKFDECISQDLFNKIDIYITNKSTY